MKLIQKIAEKISNEKNGVILRGYNQKGIELCRALSEQGNSPLAIIDINPSYNGQTCNGTPILSTEYLPKYVSCLFVIMNKDRFSVSAELTNAGVPSEKILVFDEIRENLVNELNRSLAPIPRDKNDRLLKSEIYHKAMVTARPSQVTIESSSQCNLNCLMCYYYEETNKESRNKTIQQSYTAESFDFLLDTAGEICLNVGGEPLMSPLFWDFLVQIEKKNPNATLIFKTNGVLLNDNNIRRLMNSSVTSISVSLDAATAETYQIIRGYNFEKIKRNIKNLVEARSRFAKESLRISINMTVMRENLEELPEFVRLASDLGVDYAEIWPIMFKDEEENWIAQKDNFTFFYYQQELRFYPNLANRMLQQAREIAKTLHVNFVLRSPLTNTVSEYDIEYPMKPELFKKDASEFLLNSSIRHQDEHTRLDVCGQCSHPWRQIFVFADGSVKPCCWLNSSLGNIYEQPYEDIWNSELAGEIREGIIRKRLNAVCYASNCPYSIAESGREQDLYSLDYNHVICFKELHNDTRDYVCCSGLSFPDNGGTWFNGENATISYVPSLMESHTLILEWTPFIIEKLAVRQTAVIDTLTSTITVSSEKNVLSEIIVPIGTKDFDGRTVTVSFTFLSCVSPKDLHLNTDIRKLSFHLARIRIFRAEMPRST